DTHANTSKGKAKKIKDDNDAQTILDVQGSSTPLKADDTVRRASTRYISLSLHTLDMEVLTGMLGGVMFTFYQFIFSTDIDGKIKVWLYDTIGSRVDYTAPRHSSTRMSYSADGTRFK
ncbi:topless-related protein 4-like protein isoform X1, partial [Tanacetum coccineum]